MIKKSDFALLILIVAISLVASFIVAKTIIGEPQSHPQTAEVVQPISSNLTPPSPQVFNNNAINPTVNIQIGNSANQQPFSGQ